MIRCVLLGTSAFAIPSAQALRESSMCDFLGIITKIDKPVGRTQKITSPPLAEWAKQFNVKIWQPKTKNELTALIHELQPDVAVVAAYGRIIPAEALVIPRFGFINLHPSLLPKYRGPSPVHAAILNGDSETGVTLMLLDKEIDHGPIIAQEIVAIPSLVSRLILENKLAEVGAKLLIQALPGFIIGEIPPQPQEHGLATFTPLLSREHGRLNWSEPAEILERKIRAYEGWPGTWCVLPDHKRLKILKAEIGEPINAVPGTIIPNGAPRLKPWYPLNAPCGAESAAVLPQLKSGFLLADEKKFRIACGSGTSLVLLEVQMEGGYPMNGLSFLRGYRRQIL